MATLSQLEAALRKADQAGNADDARRLAAEIRRLRTENALEAQPAAPVSAPLSEQGLRTGTSTVTGMTPTEAQARSEAGIANLRQEGGQAVATASRYGIPVGASIAAAPFTGGASILTGLAITSGAGALGGAAGEFVAQSIEGTQDPRRLASAAVYGATPFRTSGGLAARLAANVPSSMAMGELAQFIEMGAEDYKKSRDSVGELAFSMGLSATPTALLSTAGAKGAKAVEQQVRREAIAGTRFGGSVLLSETMPELSAAEATVLKRGNQKAMELYSGMDKFIGPEIMQLYPTIPETSALAGRLSSGVGYLNNLKKQYDTALAASQQAQEAAAQLRATNPAAAEKLVAEAKKSAFEAQQVKFLRETALPAVFGAETPDIGKIAMGQRMLRMQEFTGAARESVKSSLDELYSAANVGVNDPVARVPDIIQNLGGIQDDVARGEVQRAIQGFIERTPEALTGDALKLGAYRRLQADIADDLTAKGKTPNYANKVAADAYNAVKTASESFLGSALPPERMAFWRAANAASAGEFAARKSKAFDYLSKGNAAGLYSEIKTQGAGPMLNELQAYEAAIKNSAMGGSEEAVQRAAQASQQFRQEYMKLIRDGAIDSAVNRKSGIVAGLEMIDPNALAGEVQELASKGFPIQELGLGSPERIRSLARIASAGSEKGLSYQQMNDFLRDVSTFGADQAAYRQAYRTEVRNALLARGAKEQGQANSRVLAAARRAKIDEKTARMAYEEAAKDPLIQLLSTTDMKLSRDVVDNTTWVQRLMALEPTQVSTFMQTLEASGRKDVAEDLRKASAATLMRGMLARSDDGRDVVRLKKLDDFFNANDPKSVNDRETFKRIAGDEVFMSLKKNIASPVTDVLNARVKLDSAGGLDANTLADQTRFRGSMGSTQGYLKLSNLISTVQAGRYNTAYLLYAHPQFSKRYAAAGYATDKFIAQNYMNALALRLAEQLDDETGQP